MSIMLIKELLDNTYFGSEESFIQTGRLFFPNVGPFSICLTVCILLGEALIIYTRFISEGCQLF